MAMRCHLPDRFTLTVYSPGVTIRDVRYISYVECLPGGPRRSRCELPQLLARTSAVCLIVCAAASAAAQDSSPSSSDSKVAGFTLPDSTRLRMTLDILAGYGEDLANTSLGLERQGRVAYAIFTARGQLNRRFSYMVAINPVNETQPVPGCGATGFYYPNVPTALYGPNTTIPCDAQFGTRRVDEYRSVALDVVQQQGPIREAYADFAVTRGFSLRFGRVKLPIGFDWQDAGSFTSKDATRIQRINAQDNFGLMASYSSPARAGAPPLYTAHAAVNLGDGNRWWDYDYFYFEDGAFGTNSQVTSLFAGSLAPLKSLEIRASYQHGGTGSKVERLPSYWASKRNDDAAVVGVEYRPVAGLRIVAERAEYVWGPTKSSAAMLHLDPRAIHKAGAYATVEFTRPIARFGALGGSVSAERIDRADSLVKFMVAEGGMDVTTGKQDRMYVGRFFIDVSKQVRIGFYRTLDSNPFPWLSGMSPITGPRAFSLVNTDKWGFVTRLQVK